MVAAASSGRSGRGGPLCVRAQTKVGSMVVEGYGFGTREPGALHVHAEVEPKLDGNDQAVEIETELKRLAGDARLAAITFLCECRERAKQLGAVFSGHRAAATETICPKERERLISECAHALDLSDEELVILLGEMEGSLLSIAAELLASRQE
ncbi:MAG: hypothetical protein AAGB34_06050 [Planctomycetota bacterium]